MQRRSRVPLQTIPVGSHNEMISLLRSENEHGRIKDFCSTTSYPVNKFENGFSLLGLAISSNLPFQITSSLINDAHADFTTGKYTAHERVSCLELATKRFQPDLINLLLSKGLDIDETDALGRTLLIKVASEDSANKSTVLNHLIACGANVNNFDQNGNSVFGLTCKDARKTGDQKFANLANKIIVASRERATKLNRQPLGEYWRMITSEWCDNIDLLHTSTLVMLHNQRMMPELNQRKVDEELHQRRILFHTETINLSSGLSPEENRKQDKAETRF